ncbi:MAG: PAC2 family protein [Deltaproteobacteria bacterium]|nr:PAC2 family protein [Deltaproteobacteria bacterium]
MTREAFEIEFMPDVRSPILIAGFDGWGNALDISRGMVDYLAKKLDARPFARINPDLFYRFDENRPLVDIREGSLLSISPPGGSLLACSRDVAGRDIILLKASEPNLQWYRFVDALLSLCSQMGAKTIVSLGSMYDNVLHTDMVVSALVTDERLLARLKQKKVLTVNYKGPSAIHSTILHEAKKRGIECLSLWCHCPYYMQGTTHFGLLSHLGSLLAEIVGFNFDRSELDATWKNLNRQIQDIIDKNPELQRMINDLRRAKLKGSWGEARKHNKVIHLEDFMKPR